jgi:hypothetical protein
MNIYFTASHEGMTTVIESNSLEEATDRKAKLRANGVVCDPGYMASSFKVTTEQDDYRADHILGLLSA